MSFEDLFPDDATRVIAIQDGTNGMSTVVLSECQRCKAFVFRTLAHTRWHASVDTAATALLPADTAPQSSGCLNSKAAP